MNVNLGPAFDQFVAELLQSGLYQSQSEVLREALRLLKEQQETKRAQLSSLQYAIALGSAQADRGEFVNGPDVFARIRRKSKRRKAPGKRR